eukprot:719184_1
MWKAARIVSCFAIFRICCISALFNQRMIFPEPDLGRLTCLVDKDCPSVACDNFLSSTMARNGRFFCEDPCPGKIRKLNGVCNNKRPGKQYFGAANRFQRRLMTGLDRTNLQLPEPNEVSDVIFAKQPKGFQVPNAFGSGLTLITAGQYIDHDVTFTPEGPGEVELQGKNGDFIFKNSETIGSPSPDLPNSVTSFIDLSSVYSSDRETNRLLRTLINGELKTSISGNGEIILPRGIPGVSVDDQGGSVERPFNAGDVRCNEQPVLTAWHTLFVREHNRLAAEIRGKRGNANLGDERIFQRARRINIAQWQNIVFNEYFPVLHGSPLKTYNPFMSYNPRVRPGVSIIFETCSYRFGHSGILDTIQTIAENGDVENIELKDAYFNPEFVQKNGVDSIFKGVINQCAERIDGEIVDAMRVNLFGNIAGIPRQPEDLAARNTQRSRHHETPGYNDIRAIFNRQPFNSFDDLVGRGIGRECIARDLEGLYGGNSAANVNSADCLAAGLSERTTEGQFSDTFFRSQFEQFTAFRDGDRHYFENLRSGGPGFTSAEIVRIKQVKLHTLLQRNTFLNNNPRSPNFVNDAFRTPRFRPGGQQCCFSGGTADEGEICRRQPNGQFQRVNLRFCDRRTIIREGNAFYPGTNNLDCNCQQAADADTDTDT